MPDSDTANSPRNLLEQKIDLLLRTGQLLMQNGADSNRIDRNMRRVAEFLEIPAGRFHMHINYTTLMITIGDQINSFTKFRKCSGHAVNMTVISAVSRLTVRTARDRLSMDDYAAELDRIASIPHHYPRWFTLLAIGLGCGAFCRLFGGDWQAVITAALASAVALLLRQELALRKFNLYLTVSLCAFLATLISGSLGRTGWSAEPQFAVLASVLFLVPGVPLVNSVDDMVDGYTIVGLTRAIVGLLIVSAIAFGMIMGMKLLGIQNI